MCQKGIVSKDNFMYDVYITIHPGKRGNDDPETIHGRYQLCSSRSRFLTCSLLRFWHIFALKITIFGTLIEFYSER